MSLFAFFFFFWLGHDLGRGLGPILVGLNGARGARRGRSGPREKNQFNKRAGFGRESGTGMKKPDPLPFLLPTIYIKSCCKKKKKKFRLQTQIARENKKEPFFFIGRNPEDSPSSFEVIDRTNLSNPKNSQ